MVGAFLYIGAPLITLPIHAGPRRASMAKKTLPSKSAPKGKPTVGKAVKKSAAQVPVKPAANKAKKVAPAKAKVKPKMSAKTVVVAKKKVVVAKKAVVAQKKAVASKTGNGVVKKPVKTSLVKNAPSKPAPKASLKPATKAPAKVVVAPKPAAKATPAAPKADVRTATPAKTAVPDPAKAIVPAKASEAPAAVAERPAAKGLPIKKRPAKERVVMEFYLRSTPTALYELISNPSGFSEWYCDDVDVRGDQYTFIWDQEREVTTLIGRKLGEVIRFRRNDDEDPEAFFEFRVRIDAMTNETALVVTDHAWPNEVDKTRNLWASQIHSLQRVLGA